MAGGLEEEVVGVWEKRELMGWWERKSLKGRRRRWWWWWWLWGWWGWSWVGERGAGEEGEKGVVRWVDQSEGVRGPCTRRREAMEERWRDRPGVVVEGVVEEVGANVRARGVRVRSPWTCVTSSGEYSTIPFHNCTSDSGLSACAFNATIISSSDSNCGRWEKGRGLRLLLRGGGVARLSTWKVDALRTGPIEPRLLSV